MKAVSFTKVFTVEKKFKVMVCREKPTMRTNYDAEVKNLWEQIIRDLNTIQYPQHIN